MTPKQMLTPEQALKAANYFLDDYRKRSGDNTDLVLAVSDMWLVSDADEPPTTSDPGCWSEWMQAVEKVLSEE